MDDSEDATQTLALTGSQAFSAAVNPQFDDDKDAEAERQHNTRRALASDNRENHFIPLQSSWRNGTPFRINQQQPPTGERTPPPEGLRITAPARLFTIQESTPPFGNDENNYPLSPYQHQYSERALAAIGRRQLRRLKHAQEEAAFYDPSEASMEFDQYRKIASKANILARIQAYRELCGYDESVTAANGTALKEKRPTKAWQVTPEELLWRYH